MNIALNILLFGLLGVSFFQDKKSRSIHIAVFAGLIAVTMLIFSSQPFEWKIVWTNMAFVIVIITCLFLYIGLKEGQLINIFERHFGMGDLVFFICVTPLFSSRNFILFFITGIVFSGITHLIVSPDRSGETVPLAGYLAIYLMILKTVEILFLENLFYTDLL